MSISRIDRTVATVNFPPEARAHSDAVRLQQRVGLGVAVGIARTAVMVALASLAILVLLPAAIAAQAASAI